MGPPEQGESSNEGQQEKQNVGDAAQGGGGAEAEEAEMDEVEAGQAGAKETSNDDNEDGTISRQKEQEQDDDEQDNDDTAQDEVQPTRKESAAIIDTPRAASRTLVGGLIASSKSMKPFRSPLSGRPSNHNASASSTAAATPSKVPSSSSSNLAKPAITPFRSSVSSHTPTIARRSSAYTPAALNKPFRSPVVSRASATSNKPEASNASEDGGSSSMTSFQLSTALPALERRLALLKNAKRLLAAREQNEDVADNTAHIKVLSEKWLAAGREAADMLYDLTKDAYDNLDSDERQKNGGSLNHNSRKSNNGYQRQSNGWGWDTNNEEEEKQARMKAELDAMDKEQREKYLESIDREEERDPLPDINDLVGKSTRKRLSAADSENDSHNRHKKARREAQEKQDDQREDEETYNSPEEPAVEEEEEAESDSEPFDDPLKRGMARMLTQTGIDIRTLGWDAVKEEWEPVVGASA